MIEDHGDHLVVRPEDDDPIAGARGAFAHLPGPSSYEWKQEERELDAERELRRYGPA